LPLAAREEKGQLTRHCSSSPTTMTDIVRFTNGFLALPDGTAVKGDLYVNTSTGLIVAGQENFFSTGLRPSRVVDLDGGILAPGLIDVQINGAYGVDFSDLELTPGGDEKYLAGLDRVAERIVETGTTSLVPTIITQKEELYAKVS
jgi:N-acetylglucosamine-6-phosphate deacetylase